MRYASDASPYRFLLPVVLLPEDLDDVSAILSYAHRQGPRRGLPGRRHQPQRPGAGRGHPRRRTPPLDRDRGAGRRGARPYRDRVRRCCAPTPPSPGTAGCWGPDPASAIACTVGGVVANNASGMTAGTTRNSYRTLASLTFVLPSGTVVDTADPAADEEPAPRRAGAVRGAAGAEGGDRGGRGADRPHPREVHDQEHQRLPPGRLPRRGDPGGDPAGADGRLRGHLRFHRRRPSSTPCRWNGGSPARCCSSPPSPPPRPPPGFTEAGAIAAGADGRQHPAGPVSVPGVPADWAALPRETTSLLVEVPARPTRRARRPTRGRPRRLWPVDLVRPAASVTNAFTRTPGRSPGTGRPARRSSQRSAGPGPRAPR
ncbi:FAD-binding oxidoreductase [Streptomyces californicus]